jgi:hypothetical protein
MEVPSLGLAWAVGEGRGRDGKTWVWREQAGRGERAQAAAALPDARALGQGHDMGHARGWRAGPREVGRGVRWLGRVEGARRGSRE